MPEVETVTVIGTSVDVAFGDPRRQGLHGRHGTNPVLGFADGLQGVEDVELTLESSLAEDVTIPILGVNTPVG